MEYKIYVGGRFKTTTTELKIYSSYNKELIATTYLAGVEELEESISKAQSIQAELANMPSHKRYAVLMQIADSLKIERQHLATILAREAGKPLRYALGEIDRAMQTFIVAAEETKRLPKEYLSLDWTPAGEGKQGLVKFFPIGLVAGIAPFNFPLNLAVHKIAPAIAAGNPIILKPARSTPLSTLELAKIIDQTLLPKGAVSILPMDRVSGNQLVTDPRFKLLSFTGSPSVGWRMKEQAQKKKVLLELGGNAGVIVSETAELNNAVNKCLSGAFAYSGQVCIHVQRIFVHEKIFTAFAEKMVEKTKKLIQGAPEEIETEISAMIDQENAERVENWVNEAIENGAKVLCGGKRIGNFFEPTILTDTKPDMKVCALEIFGPVISIEKFSDFKQAVHFINDSEYGLQAGIFTNQLDEMNFAFKHLEVGGVIINDVPTFRVDHMPYGGVKNSGLGREGVKYAISEMMEPKLLVFDI